MVLAFNIATLTLSPNTLWSLSPSSSPKLITQAKQACCGSWSAPDSIKRSLAHSCERKKPMRLFRKRFSTNPTSALGYIFCLIMLLFLWVMVMGCVWPYASFAQAAFVHQTFPLHAWSSAFNWRRGALADIQWTLLVSLCFVAWWLSDCFWAIYPRGSDQE
jgi:hypothetical protein